MNSKKHLAIVLGIGLVLSGILYSLPKTVVNAKPEAKAEATTDSTQAAVSETKQLALSTESRNKVSSLLRNNPNATAYINISQLFANENIYDSAAHYAEKAALLEPSALNWSNAADMYYQVFSLSLNPQNREQVAEKTREVYNKVLAIVPEDPHAKTNLAMTYVGGENPMQAIMMLREVLNDNPKYIPAIMSMGGLSMQSGQYDKAVERFKQVLQIDKQNVNARLGLAYSMLETGQKQEAVVILEQLSKEPIDEVLKGEVLNTLKTLK